MQRERDVCKKWPRVTPHGNFPQQDKFLKKSNICLCREESILAKIDLESAVVSALERLNAYTGVHVYAHTYESLQHMLSEASEWIEDPSHLRGAAFYHVRACANFVHV